MAVWLGWCLPLSLEASFKQAADASKSSQNQESFEELELTASATEEVEDKQVTEHDFQQVISEGRTGTVG